MSTMSLRLPDYLHNNIREIAGNEHISVNQLVTTAIAEKVSALATEKYLNEMSAKGSAQLFDSVMSKVNKRPPLPGDELQPDT
jgi:predicted DNA-binding ribbon-helix-helix protein